MVVNFFNSRAGIICDLQRALIQKRDKSISVILPCTPQLTVGGCEVMVGSREEWLEPGHTVIIDRTGFCLHLLTNMGIEG